MDTVKDRMAGRGGSRMRSACPRNVSPRTPVLFVHHGDMRNGGEFRDFWLPLVDEAQLLAIAMEFSSTMYPGAPDGGAVQLNCTELLVAVVTVRVVGACNPWAGSKEGIRLSAAPMAQHLAQHLSDGSIPLW